MSYWMFNPCSPCCSTSSSCTSGFCNLPTGDMHLLIRNTDFSAEIHKFTSPSDNKTWTFDIPLSEFFEPLYHGDYMNFRDYCSGVILPLNNPLCTSGTSCTLRVRLSGNDNLYDSHLTRSGYNCGPKLFVNYEFLDDGDCHHGSPCQPLMEIPTKSYIYNAIYPINPLYSGTSLPYTLYDECFIKTPPDSVVCQDRCYYANNKTYNCQYGNFSFATSITNIPTSTYYNQSGITYLSNTGVCPNPRSCPCPTGYTSCAPEGSPAASGGIWYQENKHLFTSLDFGGLSLFFTDSLVHKVKDSVGDLCNIPDDLFLQVRTHAYSGCCGTVYCANSIKTGIEIDGTIPLTYNSSKGYWTGTGLNYTLWSKICTANNASGWKFRLEYDTSILGSGCGTRCDGSETGSFDDIKLVPTTALFGMYNASGCSYSKDNQYFLLLKNDKLSVNYNISLSNTVCSPFYAQYTNSFIGANSSYPTVGVKWHDTRQSVLDDFFADYVYDTYGPIDGDAIIEVFQRKHNVRDFQLLRHFFSQVGYGYNWYAFPYFNSHGFGREELYYDGTRITTCVAGTGTIIISE